MNKCITITLQKCFIYKYVEVNSSYIKWVLMLKVYYNDDVAVAVDVDHADASNPWEIMLSMFFSYGVNNSKYWSLLEALISKITQEGFSRWNVFSLIFVCVDVV